MTNGYRIGLGIARLRYGCVFKVFEWAKEGAPKDEFEGLI